ncbi:MAG: hypothetical protein SFW67_33250 [Myxococcaceae bacterium]|nr:hypothetical protein [Myxococcaceae bacterium]
MRSVCATVVLVACGGAPRPAPEPPGCATALRPGTLSADGGFELVTDGHSLEVSPGPQGGFHVFVGLEADGVERSGAIEWTLSTTSGRVLARRSLDLDGLVLEETPCGWRRRRDLLVFERNDDVPGARDVPASLVVSVQGQSTARSVIPR